MLNDPLANVMSMINNYEKVGKRSCIINPASKIILKTLSIMKDNHYVGDAQALSECRGGTYKINLIGSINKCGVIKPRFSIKTSDFEKFEKRYLPAKGMGIIVVSTSEGLMTHEEAKNKSIGGRLIAYCY
jgi:small subunit ribosomal protein S8